LATGRFLFDRAHGLKYSVRELMSPLGHKQTFRDVRLMSALPPKANIRERVLDVRFGPKAVWEHWSAKVEYLYYDLGTQSTTIVATGVPMGESWTGTTTVRNNGQLVRAGLNYKF